MPAATKSPSLRTLSGPPRLSPRRRGRWSSTESPARARRSGCRATRRSMPDFAYVGLDTAGRERRGSVRAETPDLARAQLVSRKLYVVRIEPAVEGGGQPLLSAGLPPRRRIGAKHLTLFTRQLATLITVSPLEEALRTLSRQAEREEVRRVLGAVHEGVVEARRLADAMAREPKSFPPLYRAMVAAGESSGTLPQI